jgi:Fic family protein
MENLLKKLNNVSDIQSIALQHCEFESIHPFLDGNGRVGRMIMLKQCFQNNIYPFIIDNDSKRFYYNAIEYYRVTGKPDAMTRYLQQQQEIFKVKYVKEKNKQLER